MTVRDWLPIIGALLIPVVIAGGSWWITWQQAKIEDRRAQAERKLAKQRAQDEALQAYLDQMTQLLLEENLLNSDDSVVRTIAQARTFTVLEALDSPTRKGVVIQFLSEAGLINDYIVTIPEGGAPPLSLSEANLQKADLTSNITLNNAFMTGANLRGANLRGTPLAQSNLYEADLREADLQDAYLEGANLQGARVTKEQLAKAKSIEGAIMPDGQFLKGDSNPNGPTFEEWFKRKGRGEDGANSGPS